MLRGSLLDYLTPEKAIKPNNPSTFNFHGFECRREYGELPAHPVASVVPEEWMDAPTFAALREDIKRHGQIEPVVLFQGKILDGRARHRACRELSLPTIVRRWEGGMDPVEYVVSVNVLRSHARQEVAARG